MSRRLKIDDKTFLRKCMEAVRKKQDQRWIANELRMSAPAVSYRLRTMKDAGVNVPQVLLSQRRNVEDLNDYLAHLERELGI